MSPELAAIRKSNMETTINQAIFVGIDVGSEYFDTAWTGSSKVVRHPNTLVGIGRLSRQLAKLNPALVVMEATGNYHLPLAKYLHQKAHLKVAVANPGRVRNFARSTGASAKTDALDARVLVRYAEAMKPQPWKPKEESVEELGALNTRRRQLVDMLATEKTRLKGGLRRSAQLSVERLIRYLEKELCVLEDQIREFTASRPELKEKSDLLQSVAGVGPVLATTLLAEMPELGEVDSRQAASLAGVAPFNHDSGKLKGRRSIWGGRAHLRRVLYMSALSAVTYNSAMKRHYEGLVARGKAKKVALVACMRKLLIWLNAMIRDRKPWNPAFEALT